MAKTQLAEHGANNAKVMCLIPKEHAYCIDEMYSFNAHGMALDKTIVFINKGLKAFKYVTLSNVLSDLAQIPVTCKKCVL